VKGFVSFRIPNAKSFRSAKAEEKRKRFGPFLPMVTLDGDGITP
jgi:hypothetical protein